MKIVDALLDHDSWTRLAHSQTYNASLFVSSFSRYGSRLFMHTSGVLLSLPICIDLLDNKKEYARMSFGEDSVELTRDEDKLAKKLVSALGGRELERRKRSIEQQLDKG